jgi:hypothetical protein
VQAFKRAEDGNGYIVRLREVDGKHGDVKFSLGAFADRGIASVEVVSGTEHPHSHLGSEPAARGTEVKTHLHPFETQTLRVIPVSQ